MPASTSRPANPSTRVVQTVMGVLFLVLGFQAWERIQLNMSGATRAALTLLEECEEARELLGEPIDTAWWSWSHGRIRVPRSSQTWSATSGTVDWSMPVAGSNARGVLHFQGKKAGGFWLLDGTLEAGGTSVNTRDCAEP